MLKVAMIQMQSSNDLARNLKKMREMLAEAKAQAAQVVVFPELAYFTGSPEECAKVTPQYAELVQTFSAWAKEHRLILAPGTLREPAESAQKHFNTFPLFDPAGKQIAHYRKIFLFKAALSDRNYDETRAMEPGKKPEVIDTPLGSLGLSVCFDLRFPELFRHMKNQGAKVVLLPASFTVPTGKVHWKTLVTARAIENQFFMLACGQTGRAGDGAEKYGRSLAVSPWGNICLEMGEEEGVGVVDLSLNEIQECASRIDVWASRRDDLFGNTSGENK